MEVSKEEINEIFKQLKSKRENKVFLFLSI